MGKNRQDQRLSDISDSSLGQHFVHGDPPFAVNRMKQPFRTAVLESSGQDIALLLLKIAHKLFCMQIICL